MTGQELERRPVPTVEHLWRYATAYVGSALFPDIESAEQAFVKISAGAELGLQPFQAMNGIDIIKGRPVVKPALLAGMLDSMPGYAYAVEWEGETACTIKIYRDGKLMGDSRFSMDDAEKAGLLKPSRNGTPSNYFVYPRNMLWSRAMSNAVRWYAPGLTMGPVYVPGELGEAAPVPDLPPAPHPLVTPYVDPSDPLDDVPFVDATPAPGGAESPNDTPHRVDGQPEASASDEPAQASSPVVGGLVIESQEDALALIRTLNGEQLAVLKRMLSITGRTTKVDLAHSLLEQRFEWDSQDVLAEMAGWS